MPFKEESVPGCDLTEGDQIVISKAQAPPLFVDFRMVGVPVTLGGVIRVDGKLRQRLLINPEGVTDRKWFDDGYMYTRIKAAEVQLADLQAPIHQRELDL